MPGIGIVSQVEFTDADRFIRDLAPKLVGILLTSDQPVEVGELWMTFEPVPSLDCWEVEFRHWEGREFPVTRGPDGIDSAPTARLVILLDYRIIEVDEELLSAVANALGVERVEQAYIEL